MFKAFKRWTARANTVNQLSQLSNRDLADMGITRADIYSIARGKGRNV